MRQHAETPAQLCRRAGRERLQLVGAPAANLQAEIAGVAGPGEGEAPAHVYSEALL
jgi:hypothetical protein